MPRKESTVIPEGNGPIPQYVIPGSAQVVSPILEDTLTNRR